MLQVCSLSLTHLSLLVSLVQLGLEVVDVALGSAQLVLSMLQSGAVRRSGNGADRVGGGAGRQRRAERTEKKNREKGGEVGGRQLLFSAPVAWAERKKGAGGSQGSTPRGGENGEERGGPGAARDSSAAGIGPRLAGVGDAVAARKGRAAGRERCGRERLTGGAG
jgi:hypothetical protein